MCTACTLCPDRKLSYSSSSLLHRCCSLIGSSHPHCIHSGHSVWVNWSDLPHPARHDCCDPGQRRGAGAPTIPVWLHHPHQETSLSSWTGHGPSWVSWLVFKEYSGSGRVLSLFIYFFGVLFLNLFSFSSIFFPTPHPSCRKYNIRVEDIMVRDVRYITLNSSYRELQEMLVTGQLKTLALVESRGEKKNPTRLYPIHVRCQNSPWLARNSGDIILRFQFLLILCTTVQGE